MKTTMKKLARVSLSVAFLSAGYMPAHLVFTRDMPGSIRRENRLGRVERSQPGVR